MTFSNEKLHRDNIKKGEKSLRKLNTEISHWSTEDDDIQNRKTL